jgi:hypothetical protein
MDTTNNHWIVFIKDDPQNAEYVELVYCKTEHDALEIGSKIFNIEKELLDTFEKEPHIRKKRTKYNNANSNQQEKNSYWLVYLPDVELWDAELIFCDTDKNAIRSTMYIHSITYKKGILTKKLTLHTNDVDNK